MRHLNTSGRATSSIRRGTLVCWKSAAESDSRPSLGSSFSQLRSLSPRHREGTVPGLGRTHRINRALRYKWVALVPGRRRSGPGGSVTSTPGPPRRMPRCSPSDRSNSPRNRFTIDRTTLRALGFRQSAPTFDVCDTRTSRVPVRSGWSYAASFCLDSIGSAPPPDGRQHQLHRAHHERPDDQPLRLIPSASFRPLDSCETSSAATPAVFNLAVSRPHPEDILAEVQCVEIGYEFIRLHSSRCRAICHC